MASVVICVCCPEAFGLAQLDRGFKRPQIKLYFDSVIKPIDQATRQPSGHQKTSVFYSTAGIIDVIILYVKLGIKKKNSNVKVVEQLTHCCRNPGLQDTYVESIP